MPSRYDTERAIREILQDWSQRAHAAQSADPPTAPPTISSMLYDGLKDRGMLQ